MYNQCQFPHYLSSLKTTTHKNLGHYPTPPTKETPPETHIPQEDTYKTITIKSYNHDTDLNNTQDTISAIISTSTPIETHKRGCQLRKTLTIKPNTTIMKGPNNLSAQKYTTDPN